MGIKCILMLLVVTSITVYCDRINHRIMAIQPLQNATKYLIEQAKLYKPKRCFTPFQLNCKETKYSSYPRDITRWFYSASRVTCLPVKITLDLIHKCPGIVDWVIDLPYTKKECEDLCGEPCIVTYLDYKTEPGICMHDCQIPFPSDIQNPCPPSTTLCCPRNYVASFPTSHSKYEVKSVSGVEENSQSSINANEEKKP